MGISFL